MKKKQNPVMLLKKNQDQNRMDWPVDPFSTRH